MTDEAPTLNEVIREAVEAGRDIAPEIASQWFRLQYAEEVGRTLRSFGAGAVVAAAACIIALGSVNMITDRAYRLPEQNRRAMAAEQAKVDLERVALERERVKIAEERLSQQAKSDREFREAALKAVATRPGPLSITTTPSAAR